jgi:hypothetical protein
MLVLPFQLGARSKLDGCTNQICQQLVARKNCETVSIPHSFAGTEIRLMIDGHQKVGLAKEGRKQQNGISAPTRSQRIWGISTVSIGWFLSHFNPLLLIGPFVANSPFG